MVGVFGLSFRTVHNSCIEHSASCLCNSRDCNCFRNRPKRQRANRNRDLIGDRVKGISDAAAVHDHTCKGQPGVQLVRNGYVGSVSSTLRCVRYGDGVGDSVSDLHAGISGGLGNAERRLAGDLSGNRVRRGNISNAIAHDAGTVLHAANCSGFDNNYQFSRFVHIQLTNVDGVLVVSASVLLCDILFAQLGAD